MAVALLVFFISFAASFLFAGFETGFISWNPIKVEHRALKGGLRSKLAMQLNNNPSMLITTVLIGNNIALVGMSLSFTTILLKLFGAAPEVVVNAFLTVVALIFCELLPKSLFRIYSFRLTLYFVPLMSGIYYLFWIISYPIQLITGGKDAAVSRREAMRALATEGGKHSYFPSFFGTAVERVFHSEKITIGEGVKELVPYAMNSGEGWTVCDSVKKKVDESQLKESFENAEIFDVNLPLSGLLHRREIFLQPFLFVKNGRCISCFEREEWFRKFLLFSDKD